MRGFRASRAAQNFKSSHFGKPEQHRSNESGAYNAQGNGAIQARKIPSWVRVPDSVLSQQQASQFKINGESKRRHSIKGYRATATDTRPVAKVIPLVPKPKTAAIKTSAATTVSTAKSKAKRAPAPAKKTIQAKGSKAGKKPVSRTVRATPVKKPRRTAA